MFTSYVLILVRWGEVLKHTKENRHGEEIMILGAEHIRVPESGLYKEVVYDIKSSWNSQNWTWLKFTDENFEEWCGQFRGEYKGHGISEKHKIVYVLTSDYLYMLNRVDGQLYKFEDQPEYKELSVSPNGDCVVATYYDIYVLDKEGKEVCSVDSPIPLDDIHFEKWRNNDLLIKADEFTNWDNHALMKLNCVSWKLEIVSQTKPAVGGK